MRWRVRLGLWVLCLVLCGCASNRREAVVPESSSPAGAVGTSSKNVGSTVSASVDLLTPVLRPVTDLSAATAAYRAMNGAWPATVTELKGFATTNGIPLEISAFKMIAFEAADAHNAIVRFELSSAGNAQILVPEAKGQIRLAYPTTKPSHSSGGK